MKSQKTENSFAAPIDELLGYAVDTLGLSPDNVAYKRRVLLGLFGLSSLERTLVQPRDAAAIRADILGFASENKLDGNTLCDRAFGAVLPLPDEIAIGFDDHYVDKGPESAMKYLHDLSVKGGYILKKDTSDNLKWDLPLDMGGYKVIVDRSGKIRRGVDPLLSDDLDGLSQCQRTVPVSLNGRAFDFGFNRLNYVNSQCFFAPADGLPLTVCNDTFLAMQDAVALFPKCFFACPVAFDGTPAPALVGARCPLPVADAELKRNYSHPLFDGVRISIIKYPCSAIRLIGGTKKNLAAAAAYITEHWFDYDDKDADIRAHFKTANYNCIMPIAYKNSADAVVFDLFLINNRCDKEHPHGIFAPHPDIENVVSRFDVFAAAGIFILSDDIAEAAVTVRSYLTGDTPLDFKALSAVDHPMHKHIAMIAQLANDNGLNLKGGVAEQKIVGYVNDACVLAMSGVAVFKDTDDGIREFDNFLHSINCL